MIRLELEQESAGGAFLGPAPGRPADREDLREGEINRKIERTIAYMKDHLDRPLQAAALASQANISLSHYFALFKRRTGSTPIDYFIHLRMQRACDLLAQTALTVKEVAAALGYDDPFYFSRVFKSVNGVAPTDYRLARQRQAFELAAGPLSPRPQLARPSASLVAMAAG